MNGITIVPFLKNLTIFSCLLRTTWEEVMMTVHRRQEVTWEELAAQVLVVVMEAMASAPQLILWWRILVQIVGFRLSSSDSSPHDDFADRCLNYSGGATNNNPMSWSRAMELMFELVCLNLWTKNVNYGCELMWICELMYLNLCEFVNLCIWTCVNLWYEYISMCLKSVLYVIFCVACDFMFV